MSTGHHTTSKEGHAPGFRAIRFNMDWITRPLFGILLGVMMLLVEYYSVIALAVVIAIGFIFAAFEWHRCVSGGAAHRNEALITAATVILAEAVYLYSDMFFAAVAVVLAGTAAQYVFSMRDGKDPNWQAAGVPYLAIPALCLLGLREVTHPNGSIIVAGLFLIIWFTDTGALVFGNLIGGPRLAPKLSPGKTWAGTIGGSVTGALVYASFVWIISGSFLYAFLFAFVFSFIGHGGDLLESLVKRRFGMKNSGSLIPGHGGILDRIDSTLACAPVMALLVMVAHFNPLFGVHAA